jgi:hypothetical protein
MTSTSTIRKEYRRLTTLQQDLFTKREVFDKRINRLNSLKLELDRLGAGPDLIGKLTKLEEAREECLVRCLWVEGELEDVHEFHSDDRATCHLHQIWSDQCSDLHERKQTDFSGQYTVFQDEKRNMVYFGYMVGRKESLTEWLLDMHYNHKSSIKQAMTGLTEVCEILNSMMDLAEQDHNDAMAEAMHEKFGA